MTITPPTAHELAGACWKTSTYSGANNECVEVASIVPPGSAFVIPSNRTALALPAEAFASVIRAVRNGAL